ncbi:MULTISPECIES: hypothetical protein [Streptomyces]|uniref:hypothetical protein n=1 Tax=Streptomyces TaxID=1883 RepID=UPI0003C5A995|nr:hypothetical protein [Streptomyces niveus]EST17944.1 hypothetical protein M877_39750 [Streptomyces niveus NCIMB 11891]
MDQEPKPEHAPQEGELLPVPVSRDSGRPRVVMYDEAAALLTPEARRLAEEIIAVGRVSRIAPDAQRALFVGQSGSGKTNALDLTRAQLDAAGIPYEETDEGHGRVGLRFRKAGPESKEITP